MRRTLFVLLLATGALAQNNESTLRQPGSEALSREQARSKQELCSKAEKGGNAEIGACLNRQFKITEQNYLAYIRSIGALLRLSLPDNSAPGTPKRLPFDSAEDAWLKYRDASCESMSTQWVGSQSAVAYADCRVKLTSKHMNELADLYADLWH